MGWAILLQGRESTPDPTLWGGWLVAWGARSPTQLFGHLIASLERTRQQATQTTINWMKTIMKQMGVSEVPFLLSKAPPLLDDAIN